MPFVHFDSKYAPCAFLIVKDGGDPYKETDTVLIQQDTDYPGVASRMGFSLRSVSKPCAVCDEEGDSQDDCPHQKPYCFHTGTDGTITCPDCGLTASDFIAAADAFLRDNAGETFADLQDYF